MAKSNDLSVKENGVVTKPKEYMDSLRQNLQVLMGVCDMTMSELAQKADISYETLKSIIYSDSKDCKMSSFDSNLFISSLISFMNSTFSKYSDTD